MAKKIRRIYELMMQMGQAILSPPICFLEQHSHLNLRRNPFVAEPICNYAYPSPPLDCKRVNNQARVAFNKRVPRRGSFRPG